MSTIIRKPAFCICENKGADQLHGHCAADQRLWFLAFCYTDSKIPHLPKSEISSLKPSSVVVQPGLLDLVRNTKDRFSCDVAHMITYMYLSRVRRKLAFCICENKDADQLP